MTHDPVQIGAEFQSGKIRRLVLSFWTESIPNERSMQNKLLTSNDIDLGETLYTKVVDNIDTFPASIYTPSSDKWSRSNDLRKSGGAVGNSST
jgi:hypothetical protein